MSTFLQELPKLDKKLLHLLTENLPDMLWIKDIEGKYIYANKAICDGLLMAENIEEPIGKNDVFFALRQRELHKENPNWHTFGELCFNSDVVVIEANKPMKFEEWGNVKGKLLYLEVNKAPFHDENGNILGTVGSGRDITELKLTQFQLSNQAQIIEQIHDCIITTDNFGNILTWNKSSELLFGYLFDEIKEQNINILTLNDNPIFENEEFLENITYHKKTTLLTKRNEQLICDISMSMFKEKDSNETRIIYYIKDVTEKEKLYEENKKQEYIINMQSQHVAMGQMIGNIAHQWRQPLSVISAASSNVLVQNRLNILNSESLESSLININKQVEYLSSTINTFRDFIKNDKINEEIVLQDELDKCLELLEPSLVTNYIKLYNEIDYSIPVLIKLTVGEFTQVIINIINNAKDILLEKNIINPWIKISLKIKKNSILITIEDNAGGIPEELLNKIFEPYFTTKHKSKGTGLGLYMSFKIIVESLKGKLYAKNSENGAKFHIELPY